MLLLQTSISRLLRFTAHSSDSQHRLPLLLMFYVLFYLKMTAYFQFVSQRVHNMRSVLFRPRVFHSSRFLIVTLHVLTRPKILDALVCGS